MIMFDDLEPSLYVEVSIIHNELMITINSPCLPFHHFCHSRN